MPIFAYRCRDCGKEFSTLVMSGETPVCERCESADLDQQLSLIAAPSKGGESAPATAAGACDMMGGCGCAGACPAFADA
ncbi:putative FmdB family regulatory protein [Roseiarcus fermentans]|uniref:Putative FmdB family regulatory protein n=1 Tax=Roseiarcus fermentans TaxID=1473586 RepID=A0A366FHH2_9HYPH|nr:zinc ribbon domain-containing protein [Roseiarcus fermentans]RBP14122.1 putative FmdB family regulatory protein [Roseiarcus fermentans]